MSTADPTCVRCGYDLRQAPADAACPECGLAVHRSIGERIHPDDCPPGWVRRIAIGSLLLLIAYLCLPVGIVVAIALNVTRATINATGVTLGAITFTCCTSHFVACLLLARNDPGRIETRWGTLNRWLLVLSMVPLLWSVALLCDVIAPLMHVGLPARWIQIALKFVPISFVVLPAISFDRLRRLAIRLSRPRLAEHSTIVTIGRVITPILGVALVAAASHYDIGGALPITALLAVLLLLFLWGTALLMFVTSRFFRSAAVADWRWWLADAAKSQRA